MRDSRLEALIIAQIYLGVAMARAAGVECGSPQNIRIKSEGWGGGN